MRCKICKNKIITRLSKISVSIENKIVEVINIPAFYCKNCDKEFFNDVVLLKAKDYALALNNPDVLDYAKFEEDETDEMMANGLFNNIL